MEKGPLDDQRLPARSMSRTAPSSAGALNDGLSVPSERSRSASPGLAEPSTFVKDPATSTVSGSGPGNSSLTAPSSAGANLDSIAPVASRVRRSEPGVAGPPLLGLTEEKVPPRTIVRPTRVIARTAPSLFLGVHETGAQPTTRLCGVNAAPDALAATGGPRPVAALRSRLRAGSRLAVATPSPSVVATRPCRCIFPHARTRCHGPRDSAERTNTAGRFDDATHPGGCVAWEHRQPGPPSEPRRAGRCGSAHVADPGPVTTLRTRRDTPRHRRRPWGSPVRSAFPPRRRPCATSMIQSVGRGWRRECDARCHGHVTSQGGGRTNARVASRGRARSCEWLPC